MKIIVLKTSCLLLLFSTHIVLLGMDLTAIESERNKYFKLAEAQRAYKKQRASEKKPSLIASQAAVAILQGDAIEQEEWEQALENILSQRAQARL